MTMHAFTRLTAIWAPLPMGNINTDDIYPGPSASPLGRLPELASRLAHRPYGMNAFAAWRWHADGSPRSDFVLDRPPYDKAGILVAGENFGCGSSREHAVWCLLELGIRCVIAPSFGDIFYNNCFKNGLLAIALDPAAMESLMAIAIGNLQLTVDLEEQTIRNFSGHAISFDTDAYRRRCLLEGLDEIGATLEQLPLIETFEAAYAQRRPWLA